MKKLICVLLIAGLLFALFAGCAPAERIPSSSTGSEKHDSSSQKESSKASSENSEKSSAASSAENSETSEAHPSAPDLTVKGKWVFSEMKILRVRAEYTNSENHSVYRNDGLEHFYDFTYMPDAEDPADGPDPFSASFGCYSTIPDSLSPGGTGSFSLICAPESDGKPGHTGGVCCSISVEGVQNAEITSKKGYDYSDPMVYPVYAGTPSEYGHLNDAYSDIMDDTVFIAMPVITQDMKPSSYETFTVTLLSNCGETAFVYTWKAA